MAEEAADGRICDVGQHVFQFGVHLVLIIGFFDPGGKVVDQEKMFGGIVSFYFFCVG